MTITKVKSGDMLIYGTAALNIWFWYHYWHQAKTKQAISYCRTQSFLCFFPTNCQLPCHTIGSQYFYTSHVDILLISKCLHKKYYQYDLYSLFLASSMPLYFYMQEATFRYRNTETISFGDQKQNKGTEKEEMKMCVVSGNSSGDDEMKCGRLKWKCVTIPGTNVTIPDILKCPFETIQITRLSQNQKARQVERRDKKSYLQYSKAHSTPSSPQRRKACRAAWCCRSCRRSSRHGRPGPWQCSLCLHPLRSLHSWHSALGRGRGGEAESRFIRNPQDI